MAQLLSQIRVLTFNDAGTIYLKDGKLSGYNTDYFGFGTIIKNNNVDVKDTGAASGLVNVSHQIGSSLGLGILVVIFETTVQGDPGSATVLAHRIANTMDMSALMILLAFLSAILLVVRQEHLDKSIESAVES